MCTRINGGSSPCRVTGPAALLASVGLLVTPSAALATSDNPQNGSTPAFSPNGPDLDGSGMVDFNDLVMLLSVMSNPDAANPAWVAAADLNEDGVIDFSDLSVLLNSFGQVIPPPPPEPPAPENPPPPPPEDPPAPEEPPVPANQIFPGAGFTGPTIVPDMIGNPARPGADAKAIARWDVVPYQTITGQFTVGVVAFHMNGIEKVSFSANGGEWVDVTETTLNPRTNVHEYWITLDAADFEDGLAEIRAVVYPRVAGRTRVLAGEITGDTIKNGEHSMFINTNANGSLPSPVRYVSGSGSDETGDGSRENPFRTPYFALQDIQRDAGNSVAGACDGALIYCLPGEYTWGGAVSPYPRTQSRWATVTPAPGVAKEDVVFSALGGNGFYTRLIAGHGFTTSGDMLFRSGGPEKYLWVDGVDIQGPGRLVAGTPLLGHVWTGMWVTSTRITDVRDAVQHAALVRDVDIERISCDAFSMSRLVVNSSVNDIDNTGLNVHPDVFQFKGNESIDNYIVFGVRATNIKAQGIFARGPERVDNIAFVNLLMERAHDLPAGGKASQWMDIATNHLLIIGVSMPNYTFSWRTPSLANVHVRGSLFGKMAVGSTGQGGSAFVSDSWFRNNHFVDVESYGAIVAGLDATTGDPMFMDDLNDDFRPRAGSPLVNRVNAPYMKIDARGVERATIAAVGAYEPNE